MTQRLDYIDEMKGLAILLVVLGHLFLPYTSEGQLHPWATIIYSFHMSFFFFLSGYINEKVNGIDLKGYPIFIKKKIQSLIIPFVFWSYFAQFFLNNYFPTTWDMIIEPLRIFPNRHYWFLPVLFFFFFFYAVKHFVDKKGTKYNLAFSIFSIGIFFLCGGIFNQYHLIIYGIYWASFLLGDYLSRYETFKSIMMKNSTFGVSVCILCIAWKLYPIHPTDSIWDSLMNLLLSLICSFTASISLYNFFKKVSLPKWIKKYFSEMGKFSLVIYVVPIKLLPYGFVFDNNLTTLCISLMILFIGIIHTMISYTVGRIIFEIPYLRYITFGKK